MRLTSTMDDAPVQPDGPGEAGFMGAASPSDPRGAFWPLGPGWGRVRASITDEQRAGLLFDPRPTGAPACAVGWTEEQLAALAAHSVPVRRWLCPLVDRFPSREELAIVVGVEPGPLHKAMEADGRATMAALRRTYGGSDGAGRDRGVA